MLEPEKPTEATPFPVPPYVRLRPREPLSFGLSPKGHASSYSLHVPLRRSPLFQPISLTCPQHDLIPPQTQFLSVRFQ